jgi:hypothetical protein
MKLNFKLRQLEFDFNSETEEHEYLVSFPQEVIDSVKENFIKSINKSNKPPNQIEIGNKTYEVTKCKIDTNGNHIPKMTLTVYKL